jgi:serine/threonine-protein kinase SRPK3
VAKNAFNPEWIRALKEYEGDKSKFDRDDSHVLNLLNAFLYKGPYGNHFCMVFEILGVNLW